ncbi:MAG: hypothetical protein DBX59_03165 [Bacillota bacterium]|nr:MAG: hypothetical protein DBX59_03165 [Bacillota bacterium]
MEEKIGVIAVIVKDFEQVERVNELLHEHRDCIVGRLGLPFREEKLAVISLVLKASQEKVNALSGKLGMLKGVSCKAFLNK